MLRKLSAATLLLTLFSSCATPPEQKVLTISEQIEVDTREAGQLYNAFRSHVQFLKIPEAEKFLDRMAQKLAKVQPGFQAEKTHVRIHNDADPQLVRFFSFPGTTVSLPLQFLKEVTYENELAAAVAFELANVMNRHLARKMEKEEKRELLGKDSLFNLTREERKQSIDLGTKLLYYAGYDLRGMASVFQRYERFYRNQGLALEKKEVEFNIREAQQARSQYLPSLNPIVRSAEFITMKKGLKRL